ncbi:hypothetical protein A9R05_44405 (plasmid) [Burkholderia sp. KK1]|uniref:Uncharacterized protein n=1 Tax=Burkholderia sp. M701 TaxID=326454 RepID=V5YPM6_9BURK|nr:hypothetical protein [Burkholderia sp. M701]AQH05993.1 hypothetical protein A9R05_44405 [Burkholderia sp. KK1]BAO19229.1 hypothetical protein [Burkholderia sp. M701]
MNQQEDRKLPAPSKYRDGTSHNPIDLEVDQLPLLGIARIDSVGGENIYIVKDDLHYYCKVMETESYDIGDWDFVQQRKLLEHGQVDKIDGMNLVNVNGRRYEWNETFSAYWSVEGEPRALQRADLVGADVRDGTSSAVSSHNPSIERLYGGVLVLHTKESDMTFIVRPGVNEHETLMEGARLDKLEAAKLFERAQQLSARAKYGELAAGLCKKAAAEVVRSASPPDTPA